MNSDNRQQLGAVLQSIEKEGGLDLLATTLSECLCAVAARRSADNPQVITVNTGFVEGEVHVVFGPGNSVLDK